MIQRIKKYFYIMGFILLIIIIFFKENVPARIASILWIFCYVLLLLIVVSEIVTRKKNEK